jgi:ribosomal protein S12 methylthiotransferase accessory factor YcaO
MTISAYKLIVGDRGAVASQVSAGLGTWQPLGPPILDNDGYLIQPVIQGAPSEGVPPGSVPLSNGDTVAVVNSAGAASHNGTATVTTGALTNVKLAATAAMVDNAQQLTIPVTGVYATKATLTVANGVVTAIVLS